MVSEKHKFLLISIISKHVPQAKIYLFGSRATGLADSGADIDIAVDAGSVVDQKTLFDIADEVSNSTLPYFVDVVDLCAIDQDFYSSIKKDLVVWK